MVETAAQASSAVAAARFMPAGRRSAGGVHPIARGLGRYVRGASQAIGIMIESRTGAANAAAIAAIDGVDFIFIGSGYLALSLANEEEGNVAFNRAYTSILQACHDAAKPCGIFTPAGRTWSEMLDGGLGTLPA